MNLVHSVHNIYSKNARFPYLGSIFRGRPVCGICAKFYSRKYIAILPEIWYNNTVKEKFLEMFEELGMKAVVTVVGQDSKGIIAKVSTGCAEAGANIVEISQSVLKEYFAMIMVIDIDGLTMPFTEFVDTMRKLGVESGLDIRAMHEDIFNTMHHI